MHVLLLIALLGVMGGVVCGELSVYGSEIAVATGVLSLLQFGIYFFERRTVSSVRNIRSVHLENESEKSEKNYVGEYFPRRISLPLASGIFFICVALGIIRVQLSEEKNNFICTTACSFHATIITGSEVRGAYQIFTVRPSMMTGGGAHVYDVHVKVALYPKFSLGEEVELFGKVLAPTPQMEHEGKNAFDYGNYLRLHNVGSEMLYPKIEVASERGSEGGLVERLQLMKESFLSSITRYVSEPSASLASGMLFGNSSMSQELTQTFRVAGLSHIVVLSGFNIAILITFVLFILMFVPLFLRIILAGIIVVFFVLMVGAEVSIIRATLMSALALVALLLGRQYTARHALLISLLLIVLYEPTHLLSDVSLHLSFLATAGIVYMSDDIKKLLTKIRSTTYQEILTTTLSAYIATLPYLMYTFGTVSLYALLANIIVLPFVPVMMLMTFLVVAVSPLSSLLGMLFGYVTTLLGSAIIFVARTVEGLPLASIHVTVSLSVMSFIYVCIALLYFHFVRTRKNETSVTKNDEILSEVISY